MNHTRDIVQTFCIALSVLLKIIYNPVDYCENYLINMHSPVDYCENYLINMHGPVDSCEV